MSKDYLPVSIKLPATVRKVIQVACNIDPAGKYFILALCNDGTLWKLSGLYEGKPEWETFPTPPPGREE